MGFKEILSVEKSLVEEELKSFLDREAAAVRDIPLAFTSAEALKEYTLRDGKRVRAVLVLLGYRAVGGRDMEKARKAAVSMELVQSMLLVHDDIMDRSPERRGGPSMHEGFKKHHMTSRFKGKDAGRYGQNMALILGDLAESLAEKALLSAGFPPERTLAAMLCQAEMVRDTGYGQIMDLHSIEVPEWKEEDVLKVHELKTARYTFEGPLHIGARLHGATKEQLDALSGYALPVGTAFQLTDDILGLFGDPKRGGRQDISDLREGKRTLLIIKALERADDRDRKAILSGLGDPALTVRRADRIREVVRRTGSEEHSRKLASKLTKKGIGALKKADLDPQTVKALSELALNLLGRV